MSDFYFIVPTNYCRVHVKASSYDEAEKILRVCWFPIAESSKTKKAMFFLEEPEEEIY